MKQVAGSMKHVARAVTRAYYLLLTTYYCESRVSR